MNKIGSIYVLTCTVNGKQYVGKTWQVPSARWTRHINCALRNAHPGVLVHRAIKKYGVESFTAEVIETHQTENSLARAERRCIKRLNTLVPSGYNLTVGGDGSPGLLHTEKTCKLLSKKSKAWYANLNNEEKEQRKEVLRAAARKRWSKPSARIEMSQRLQVQWQDEDYAKKMSKARKLAYSGLKDRLADGIKKHWADAEQSQIHRANMVKAQARRRATAQCQAT